MSKGPETPDKTWRGGSTSSRKKTVLPPDQGGQPVRFGPIRRHGPLGRIVTVPIAETNSASRLGRRLRLNFGELQRAAGQAGNDFSDSIRLIALSIAKIVDSTVSVLAPTPR